MRCKTCHCQAMQDHIAVTSKPSTLEELCEKKTLPAGKELYTPYALHMTANWYMCICDASTFLNLIYTYDILTFRHFDERSETSVTRKSTCKNISEDANLQVSQKPRKYMASYAQIRYLMKRLSTALSSKLREGRPRKYCKRCGLELRPTNLCKPKGIPQELLTMKQRIANTDKKERMETSQ